jgi:hypothetical protein
MRRFLVAVRPDGNGRASMFLDQEPTERSRKNIGEFYRKYAAYDIRECSADEMQRLMTADAATGRE